MDENRVYASVSSASDGSGFTKNFDLFMVLLFGFRLYRAFNLSFKAFYTHFTAQKVFTPILTLFTPLILSTSLIAAASLS